MRKTKLLMHHEKLLALNLDWLPLLGDAGVAKQQAKRLKASHSVISGKPAGALGIAYGIKEKKCWAMAELFANLYPKGTYACVFSLSDDYWHVLASHEGVVLVHADRGYASKDMALSAIYKFLTAYPGLEIIKIADIDNFYNRLLEKISPSSQLMQIKYGYSKYIVSFALPATLVAWQFWPQAIIPAANMNNENNVIGWEQSLAKVLAENPIHGLDGTQKLLNNIQVQPLSVAGWVMKKIQCNPGAVGTRWLCLAEYRRQNINADNKGFIKKAPSYWRIDYQSLDLIQSRWAVDIPGSFINLETLPKSKIIETSWASELQYILPAFTELHLSSAQPIKIPAPLTADGVEPKAPESLPYLANRKLQVSGPLRSAVLLKKISDSVAWKNLLVRYVPGVNSNTKASSLTIRLEGYVYETRS